MTSLPVPLSPVISTVVFERRDHGRRCCSTSCIFGDAADDVVEAVAVADLAAQRLDLAQQRRACRGALDDDEQLVDVERLGDVVEGAELHGAHRRLHRLGRGQHDHLRHRAGGPHALEHFEAVEAGHQDVEQDDVEGVRRDQLSSASSPVGDQRDLARDPSG